MLRNPQRPRLPRRGAGWRKGGSDLYGEDAISFRMRKIISFLLHHAGLFPVIPGTATRFSSRWTPYVVTVTSAR